MHEVSNGIKINQELYYDLGSPYFTQTSYHNAQNTQKQPPTCFGSKRCKKQAKIMHQLSNLIQN